MNLSAANTGDTGGYGGIILQIHNPIWLILQVRKYLIPDSNDEIRQEQMREMELLNSNSSKPVSNRHVTHVQLTLNVNKQLTCQQTAVISSKM